MSYQVHNRLIRLTTVLGILIVVFPNIHIAQAQHNNFYPCVHKDTCRECLQAPQCTWCEQPDYNGSRCMANYWVDRCSENYRIHHDFKGEIVEDKELTQRTNESQKIFKLRPQRLNLKMPINQAHRVNVQYREEDFPIDVYFLMDLSKSTESDIEQHIKLAEELSQEVEKITWNFRLGFGIFGKKKTEGEDSYVFHNHLALSSNSSAFKLGIKNAAVPGNVDASEDNLKALIQALACREHIGWRTVARHILIFSSDAGYQYSSDGKLNGVAVPNDGECHLDRNGLYTESTKHNYPTLSQINQKVMQSAINIIFAVRHRHFDAYKTLSQNVPGSTAGVLSNDSSNVIELVKYEYSKISTTIEMKDTTNNHVQITYYSSCLRGRVKKTSRCDGLRTGDVVNFTAEILITSCPKDPRDWKQDVKIYPVGMNESLIIDLTMLCSCDCENPNHRTYEERSSKCNFAGTHMCGSCVCDNMHFGQACECAVTDSYVSKADLGCRADNTTLMECSGHGTCICGQCECAVRPNSEERYSGKYCEYDNFSCARSDGTLCSGPDHGICESGQCNCSPEWEGPDCDCLKSTDPCLSPNSGEICSGHGICQCGQCTCDSTEYGRFSGEYCEKFPTCSNRCLRLKDCVQCQMYRTGPLKDPKECITNCTNFTPAAVEKVEIDEKKNEQLCMFYDEDDCKFIFKYSEVDCQLQVHALEERQCPPIAVKV